MVLDYFSQFTWATAYAYHFPVEVDDMFVNHISPVFGQEDQAYTRGDVVGEG